jgi:hypothetical protein
MATIYKKISVQELRNTQIPLASFDDKLKALTIINSFVNLFKQKHL